MVIELILIINFIVNCTDSLNAGYTFRESLAIDYPPRPVRNGDIIQIVHGVTGRALNR